MHSIDKESTNSGVAILIHIVGVYEYKNDENWWKLWDCLILSSPKQRTGALCLVQRHCMINESISKTSKNIFPQKFMGDWKLQFRSSQSNCLNNMCKYQKVALEATFPFKTLKVNLLLQWVCRWPDTKQMTKLKVKPSLCLNCNTSQTCLSRCLLPLKELASPQGDMITST